MSLSPSVLPCVARFGEPWVNMGLCRNTQGVWEGRKSVVYQNQAALGLIKSEEKAPAALCRLGIRQSPTWAISTESWIWFLSVCEAGVGCPLGALLQGVCLLQLCLFLSPCCSAEPLGELSISHLVLLSPDPSCGCRRRKSSEVHLNSQSLNFLSYQTIFALCSLRKHLK